MRVMLIAAVVFAASPALSKSPTPAQLEAETWRAFKAKRSDEVKTLFAPDYVGLYADGTHDLGAELRSFQKVTIEDYRLTVFNKRSIDSDDELLTYAADVKLKIAKKPVSERIWMSSLWHREDGRWRCVYHSEIKAK